MWTVVYIAANRELAEQVKKALDGEGILATIKPVGLPLLGETCNHEVLVAEAEAEEAHEFLSIALRSGAD